MIDDLKPLLTEVEEILDGIDKTEIENKNGWWETSEGAKFGEHKLELIRNHFENYDTRYWSTFLTEEHTDKEKQAWIKAYTQYLSESPNRPGWCQKKADDDYGKFME